MPTNPVPAAAEGLPKNMTGDVQTFPIPYFNQNPADDMHLAMQYLRVVDRALERASGKELGLSRDEAADMLLVLSSASKIFGLVQDLLDDDRVPSHVEIYRSVRMADVLENWKVAQ